MFSTEEIKAALAVRADLANADPICPHCGRGAERGSYSFPFCSETCANLFAIYLSTFPTYGGRP